MLTIFWFRRDLRLEDNAGLYQALKSGNPVLPVFIFDKNILDLLEDKKDRRVEFIHQYLQKLKEELNQMGSSIAVYYGDPMTVWKDITERYPVEKVFTNEDYEPYARQRDMQVKDLLTAKNIEFQTFKDQVIFEKSEILSDSNKPYSVYSPYGRKWRKTLNDFYLKSYPTNQYFQNFLQKTDFEKYKITETGVPELASMDFQNTGFPFPQNELKENIIKDYGKNRDFPAIEGTSRLSVHLRFGTVSIRVLARKAVELSDSWLNELCWRDFYMMIIHQFPHAAKGAFKPAYEQIKWQNNSDEFQKWCEGKTGYPIVDAGMRELNATGFMHNRVRMITASFLCKHLLIDWRWGEAYFAKKLLDFDLSANNGGWQWASSSGCDAAPYFRIFNPSLQTGKFDKDLQYIKKWVPEINDFNYKPIVDHAFARERALKTYKEGLGS